MSYPGASDIGGIATEPNRKAGEGRNRDRQRRNANFNNRQARHDVRDIGPPPKCKNTRRRGRCKNKLKLFLTTYFPDAFYLKFGDAHLELIADVQRLIFEGGHHMVLMPRGSGKTSILQRAVVWSALNSHTKFPVLIGADKEAADRLMVGIKTILMSNELIIEDYPEVCHPIIALENIGHRCRGQMVDGERTGISWGKSEIQFPQYAATYKAGNAGVGIRTTGIEGSGIRGSQIALKDGKIQRVDLVLVDDVQTRKSAGSKITCDRREDALNADVLGMGGPGKKISCFVTATSIYPEDVTARLKDRERNPHWETRSVSMVQSWPANTKLWDKWDGIRREAIFGECDKDEPHRFYKQNKEAMQEDFIVYWPDRVEPDYIDAYDSAMGLYYDSPRAFASEYQNDPEGISPDDFVPLSPLLLAKRVNQWDRNVVPPECEHIVAHVDVQKRMLFWAVCGVTNAGGMHVLSYGTTPQQTKVYFDYQTSQQTLQEHWKGETDEACIRMGVAATLQGLNEVDFERTDGAKMGINLGLIDVGYHWGDVEAGIMVSGCTNWLPARGVGIRASDTPLGQRVSWKGTKGDHWILQKPKERTLRSLFIDVNYWKSSTYQSLKSPIGHPEAIVLYKDQPSRHQLFCDHLCREDATEVSARGLRINEWTLRTKMDNHYWDNLVGCTVAANYLGVKKGSARVDDERKRQTVRPRIRIRI